MKRMLFALCGILCVAAGCGKEEVQVDAYPTATLREATYGEIISPDFRYELDNPEIVDALGDFLVIRQGNLTQFMIGTGLAAKVDSFPDDSKYTFHVVKNFSPMVHFMCESFKTDKGDSVAVSLDKPVAFPRSADAIGYTPSEEHMATELSRFKWNDTESLRADVGKKFSVRARLVRAEEKGEEAWFIEGHENASWGFPAKFRIRKPRPSMEIVLRMLDRTEQDFVGGFTYTDIEPWVDRRDNHVNGTVDLTYVRFLDKVFIR